ncbi:hypothetical protein HPB51_029829 [Rhipicephalus microplus]|uniref:Tick transposon n=1 Tax=Rhipicephalus microplus TaxID=6941 RepID=A0A9J6CT80_RHIMP|nr:hypothetical protein HPB51_029829 [Rhipicephalus microplus]
MKVPRVFDDKVRLCHRADPNMPEAKMIVREKIVKEKAKYTLQSHALPLQESTVASVAEVVRHELRQALASPQPYAAPRCHSNSYTYADTVHRRLAPEVSYQPNGYSYADAFRRPTPMPALQYLEPYPVTAWTQQDSVRRPYIRNTNIWRTADHRPLCYNFGEPGHIYRFCPHRLAQYHGSAPTTTCRQFDGSRALIDDDQAGWWEGSATFWTRSSSPARFGSPNRRSFELPKIPPMLPKHVSTTMKTPPRKLRLQTWL